MLQETYAAESWRNTHSGIRRVVEQHGFERQRGSVCLGDETVASVSCVVAAMEPAGKYDRFEPSVRDIRMLRSEEDSDFMPAFERGKDHTG